MLDASLPWPELLLRLGVALALGGVIGWEREVRKHSAGLRTHMMVALGAAAFTLLGLELLAAIDDASLENMRADPLRIISGIVGGIGFLGAGAIIQSGGRVRGLTTAAGLWVVASVGIAAGMGRFAIAAVLAVLAVVTLGLVQLIEPRNGEGDADP